MNAVSYKSSVITGPVTVKPFSMLERPPREKGLHCATRFDRSILIEIKTNKTGGRVDI
jgi:hypothetical protein